MKETTNNNRLGRVFMHGIIAENPTFRLVLGTCPTLATTISLINGFSMGIATMFVLVGSNVVISLLKNFIPEKVRIPAYIVVIATFVSIVQMVMQAFFLDLYNALGVFIPLIVVNCIILARAEAFAGKPENSVLASAVDGLGMGIGFTIALSLMGAFREIVGSGTLLGSPILGEGFAANAFKLFATPAGGFFTFGLFLALFNLVFDKIDSKRKARKEGV